MQAQMSEEEQREKNLQAMRKHNNLMITSIHNAVKVNDKRMDMIRDPIAKNLIPIYMVSSIIDILSVAISVTVESENITEESAIKMIEITSILDSRLNSVIDWIQSPIYNPSYQEGSEIADLREKIRVLLDENKKLKQELDVAKI